MPDSTTLEARAVTAQLARFGDVLERCFLAHLKRVQLLEANVLRLEALVDTLMAERDECLGPRRPTDGE